MTTKAVDQAAHEFRELLTRTARGEEFTMIDRGSPVARLVPPVLDPRAGKPMTLEELCQFREAITLGPDLTIRQLIDEGRRY